MLTEYNYHNLTLAQLTTVATIKKDYHNLTLAQLVLLSSCRVTRTALGHIK